MICMTITQTCLCKEIPSELSKWLPTLESYSAPDPKFYAGNSFGTSWDVYLTQKGPKVRRFVEPLKSNRRLRLKNGVLSADHLGEFGSRVIWKPIYGRDETYSNTFISEFVVLSGRIFGLSGLAHMDANWGMVVELNRKDTSWRIANFARLKDAPILAVKESAESMLVLTYSSLTRVSINGRIKQIVTNGKWDALCPRSLVTDGRHAFVGFQQRVAKVDLETREVTYYIPYPEVFEDDLKKLQAFKAKFGETK